MERSKLMDGWDDIQIPENPSCPKNSHPSIRPVVFRFTSNGPRYIGKVFRGHDDLKRAKILAETLKKNI